MLRNILENAMINVKQSGAVEARWAHDTEERNNALLFNFYSIQLIEGCFLVSSLSMAFPFVGSLCEYICLCLFVVLFTCFHITLGINKAPEQCFVYGHNTKTQDVDTLFGSIEN